MKKEVESNLGKPMIWYEMPVVPKPEIMVKVFPFDELTRLIGQRLAAKIAFERFCQIKKQPGLLTDSHFNKIREFIRNGTKNGVHSHLFFDFKIMDQNLPCAFPWHSIFIVQRNKALVQL